MRYETALQVVRRAESALVGNCLDHRMAHWVQGVVDTVLRGPLLVIAGGHILLGRIVWVFITAIIFSLVFHVLDGQSSQPLVVPSILLAIGVVYFSTPSRSMVSGVNAKQVDNVRQFILSITPQPLQLQILSDFIDVVRTHTMQKLARFNVLAGLVRWHACVGTWAARRSGQSRLVLQHDGHVGLRACAGGRHLSCRGGQGRVSDSRVCDD